MDDVRRQLIVHERNGRILKWHDRMIPSGSDWGQHIDDRLERAHIILLFMSPHFIESRYCYEIEGQAALKRHSSGEAVALPIILRPCAWQDTPFGKIQALPEDAKPISRWQDRDEACLDAARGVMSVVDRLTRVRGGAQHLQQEAQLAPKPMTSIVYCSRCGTRVGDRSMCIGAYTGHEFVKGSEGDYCERCGITVGSRTMCTGSYTSHSFVRRISGETYCVRCGAAPGERSMCTGAFTAHEFRVF